ncbi:MAG: M14 family zinc carboxypeptidase, partial [Candidatus Cloacimonetes bacterium]|nr:M14 family zinc carboxypeptidase [Candidatus Cloacimonadota bacterium]
MKPILCLLLLSLCFSLLSAELLVIRIESPTPALVKSFYDQGYDIASYRPGEYLDLVVDEATYKSLKISFPGAYIHDSEEQMKSNLTSPDRTLPGYQTYPAILDSLSVLAQQYPDLLRIVNIGSSWGKYYAQEGHDNYEDFQHDIVAVILSDNAALDEDEPAFYYVGAHHAREPISSEVVMGILSHFLDGYGTDDEITALVDDNELWFIPVLNPDGHKIVLDQTYTMMRKNIRDNNQNHTIDINYDGVDLNRNYGFEWGFIGAIDNPSDQTYHGLGPFSELETVAFRDFLGQRHFLGGISYHSYGCLVLYPYGYISNLLAPDAQELAALGSQMASSIGYTCTPSWQLYPTSGNLDDYAYGTYGTFAYTIELSYIFIPPAIQIPTIVNANLAAAKLLASRRNYSVLTGKVTAADTGEALPAYIHVVGIDDSPVYRTPYRANQDFGSYWRFLPPGNYTVRYYLQGYQAQERQVSITETGITTEEVELSASEHIDLLISLKDTYGNPISGTCIEFLDTNIPDVCFGPEGTIFYHQFPTGHYRIRIIKDSFEPLNLYV